MKAQDRLARLDSAAKAYAKALRWGHYEIARGFLQPRHTPDSPANLQELDEIRVTSYEIVNKVTRNDSEEAVIQVQFSFYHASSGNVHTIVDEQLWWYDPDGSTWRLDGQLPDFASGPQRASRR
jgi:hypothetical protein